MLNAAAVSALWVGCAAAADLRIAGPSPGAEAGATVTALADGRIVIHGGGNTSLWNPVGRHWEFDVRADRMPRRSWHSASSDGAGRVVFIGGVDIADYAGRQAALNSSTIWNLKLNTWDSGPGLILARVGHAAVTLRTHEILVTGGSSAADHGRPLAPMLAGAEKLGEKTTVTMKPMAVARALHAALLLADGRVLVTGGVGSDAAPLSSTEIYDPSSDAWIAGPDLLVARSSHCATLLPDGRVLVTGGLDDHGQVLGVTETWTPGTDRWQRAPDLAQARAMHSATLLPSGDVLLSGGTLRPQHIAPVLELWHDGGWRHAGYLPIELQESTSVLAPGGQVLIFGRDPYAGPSVLAWLPDTPGVATPGVAAPGVATPTLDTPMDGTLTRLRDGRLLLAGGTRRQVDSAVAELYDPVTRAWASVAPLHQSRARHQALALIDGRLLVLGGRIGGQKSAGSEESAPQFPAEIWDPATDRWTFSRSLAYASGSWSVPARLRDGRVLLAALDESNEYATKYAYLRYWDPAQDSLSELTTLTRPWLGGHGALLPDGSILYAGGTAENARRTDRWDPLDGGWRPQPMAPESLEGHTLRALEDGRVIAWKIEREPAAPPSDYLLWQEDSGWERLPAPPGRLAPVTAHALPRGDVLLELAGRESWVWSRVAQRWQHIAHEHAWDPAMLVSATADGEVLAVHGMRPESAGDSRLTVSRLNLAEGRWQPDSGEYLPRDRPTLLTLDERTVMVTAGGSSITQLWDARRNEWRYTGFLPRPLLNAVAARLTDGRVMLAGIERDGNDHALYCELWNPAGGRWSECGRFVLDREESYAPVWLRPLDHSRALLVYGRQHALFWTPPDGWAATRLQFPQELTLPPSTAAGTPYRAPLGSAWDPQANAWIDATDALLANGLRLATVRLRDGSVMAIANAGALYRWDPAQMRLFTLALENPPEDRALTALTETVPGCIAAWNNGRQQSLPYGVRATMPGIWAGDPVNNSWNGNADLNLSPLNASATALPDGTLLIAGNTRLPGAAGGGVQRIKATCDSMQPLDPARDFHLPTATAPPPPKATHAKAGIESYRPAAFPQRWLSEWRAQLQALPAFWFLKLLAAFAVLWPLTRYAERWETYVTDDDGRTPGRRTDFIIAGVALPAWIGLVGFTNSGWKVAAAVVLAIAAFVSARRLWINAQESRQKQFAAVPLTCAWVVAVSTLGTVFATGVSRWFAFLTDYH